MSGATISVATRGCSRPTSAICERRSTPTRSRSCTPSAGSATSCGSRGRSDLSLRARLLIGLVVLAAIGLGAAALVTYEEQRSFLLTKIDQQVAQARLPVSVRLGLVKPRLPAGPGGAIRRGTG